MKTTTSAFASLLAAGAMVTAQVAEAQNTRLTSQESQYVNLLDDEEFQKANFYVQQGLVDPANLSTGKSLVYYLFPGPDCDGPKEGYCGPTLKVINSIAPHFDFNEPLRDGKRPATYICWGRQGALLTSQYAVENGWELDFHDDDGLQPFHYCANQRPYEPGNERVLRIMTIMQNMLDAGVDVNVRTTKQWGDYGEGATPLLIAIMQWWGDNDHPVFIDYLLENGADIDAVDANGAGIMDYMPYPSRNRHYEPTLAMMRKLHAAGADIMRKNPKTGESHFDRAMRVGDVDFAMAIMEIAGG